MRFINKFNPTNSRNGVRESQQILDNHWEEHEESYRNLRYDVSKMDGLRRVLLNEQKPDGDVHSYCCYCMRRLYYGNVSHANNVTLEHIIPNNISERQWSEEKDSYVAYAFLDDNRVQVCCGGKLHEEETPKIAHPPHPHFVAYHNISASCDGSFFEIRDGQEEATNGNCCNLKRRSLFVPPVYFVQNIEEKIQYDKKGNIVYDKEVFGSTLFDAEHLNLMCDLLCSIRRLWYKVSQSAYSVQNIENALSDHHLRTDILDDVLSLADNKKMAFFYDNEKAWSLFIEYSWFYHYYKTKYPA